MTGKTAPSDLSSYATNASCCGARRACRLARLHHVPNRPDPVGVAIQTKPGSLVRLGRFMAGGYRDVTRPRSAPPGSRCVRSAAGARRQAYVQQVMHAVKSGGHVIVATFGPEGPKQ